MSTLSIIALSCGLLIYLLVIYHEYFIKMKKGEEILKEAPKYGGKELNSNDIKISVKIASGNSKIPLKITNLQDVAELVKSENLFNQGTEFFNKGDYINSIKYFEQAANLNDKDAFYQLGNAYLRGQGVKPNFVKAYEYYLKSANLEHEKAQYNVGLLYLQGQGVRQNYEEAKRWLQISANNGYYQAKKVLDHLENN